MTSLAPLPPPAGRAPQAVVDEIAYAAKSSFAIGVRLVPRERRAAMRAVYAFCRIVDDIADSDLARAEKRRLLQCWREEVMNIADGKAESAIGRALVEPTRRFSIPVEEFTLVIEGMEMDVEGPMRAPDETTLARYIRRVAGAVGMISMRCFGAWRSQRSGDFALSLAEALQLVNILRDIEEDAAIGRIYLPAELLDEVGVACDPATLPSEPALPDLRAEMGARARLAFARSREAMEGHDRRTLWPALAMRGVYEGYLDRIEAAGWQAIGRMGRGEKLWRGMRGALWSAR